MVPVTTLEPGANASLTAKNPLLKDLIIGFGWDIIRGNGPLTELVPSAIMCNRDGQAVSDEHFVFFNQLSTPDEAVQYVTGDDQEQIEVDLSLIPDTVEKIVFIVYADPDIRKPGTFAAVRHAYIRVADREDNDMVRFSVPDNQTSDVTAMIFGELYRYKSEWKFRAIGQGYSTGLVGVAHDYNLGL